jgi:hypothetical protein
MVKSCIFIALALLYGNFLQAIDPTSFYRYYRQPFPAWVNEPYTHFIPVTEDLSNIFEQLDWAKKNDQICIEEPLLAKGILSQLMWKRFAFQLDRQLGLPAPKGAGLRFEHLFKFQKMPAI